MRLAGTRLSVGEYCAVVTLKYIRNDRRGSLIVDVLLCFVGAEGVVERELLRVVSICSTHVDFTHLRIYLDNLNVSGLCLLGAQGSASDCHLHTFVRLFSACLDAKLLFDFIYHCY